MKPSSIDCVVNIVAVDRAMKTSAIFIILLIPYTLLSNVCSNKLVIDTDGGADDASSILLALSAWAKEDSDYEVVAITCVHGNTFENNVEENILKTVTVANASGIKIYRGAEKPLVGNTTFDNFFGNDGLRDFEFEDNISSTIDKSTYAAVALTELAKSYPRNLSVLCLGPLTNIAIAASLDPNFMVNVKRFYIMGGSVAGVGNKAPGVEFNFIDDPESNFIVLNYTREKPSLLYPWETVLNAKISSSWRKNILGSIDSKIIHFLNKAESKALEKEAIWSPADLQATAVMIWPNLIKKSVITNVTPVYDGAARGAILVDYTNRSGKPPNVEIVQELDVENFQQKLISHFS